ncbi:MAG: SH3 domain-containing protein [Clostridia bacterium]
MNNNGFWQCPHCGTVNNGPVCRVCQYAPGGPSSAQKNGGGKNKGLLIGLVAACAVLLIAAAGLVIYLLGGSNSAENESDAVVPVAAEDQEGALKEGDLFINAFDDSGIYIRKEPTKSSKQIAKIKKGDRETTLTYLGETVMGDDQYRWYKVETEKGKTGYVREDVVERLVP